MRPFKLSQLEEFYRGKKVLVTGHTGFKGSWMCRALSLFGAKVVGYALEPPTEPSLFRLLDIENDANVHSVIGDICDYDKLLSVFKAEQPEIVIHMAAQPIVRTSYKDPRGTYETNVMGTVNVLEATRNTTCVKSLVNVTTDKVYLNREWERGYREDEELNGYDPYSNSKSCSELVTGSYIRSFFSLMEPSLPVTTCRAGNVIGGGDFAVDRIIPDCIRAAGKKENIIVRNPYSTRPYQHVLEPVMAYLWVAMAQYEDASLAGSYNVGPDDESNLTTGQLVTLFCEKWGDITWENKSDGGPHEAGFLKLDTTKIKNTFGWHPIWNVEKAMEKIVEWTKVYMDSQVGSDLLSITDKQIREYLGLI